MLTPRILDKDLWPEYFALGSGGACTRASAITPWSPLLTVDCDIVRSEFAKTRQQEEELQPRQSLKAIAIAKAIGRNSKPSM